MGILDIIRKVKKKIIKEVTIGPQEVKVISRDDILRNMQKKIGYLEADLAFEKEKRKSIEKKYLKKEEINVNEVLSKRELELMSKEYLGAFSFRKLFSYILRRNKKILVTSFDGGEVFGTFEDFLILKDGRFAIKLEEEERPILSGKDTKSIFYMYQGITNTLKRGFIPLCLSRDGGYVENIIAKEVPDIIEVRGKRIILEDNDQELYKIIEDKNRLISRLMNKLEIISLQLHKEYEKNRDLKRKLKSAIIRAETAEGLAEKMNVEYQQLRIQIDQLIRENATLEHSKKIVEDYVRQLWKSKDDWMEKVKSIFPKDVAEREMDKFKQLFDYQMKQIIKLSDVMEKVKPQLPTLTVTQTEKESKER